MTDDLVSSLRLNAEWSHFHVELYIEAADRIEKLEAALNEFLDDWDDGGPMCKPLRKALEGKDD